PVCSAKNDNGAMECAICSQSLVGVKTDPTRPFLDTTQRSPHVHWGDIHLKPNAVLVLYILTTGQLKVLPRTQQLIIGRAGASGLQTPDIDLTPYGALECGVSRRHAALKIQDEAVFITDLGSMNGTYLNALPLVPGEARIIRTGDEVRFANLVTQLYFRVPTTPDPSIK
ncbi:MAG: FHA domain-containing protein, partial [Anaerolineae bacterium]|nr:FHA domain-containing protein [Anaerolineae bacterium]